MKNRWSVVYGLGFVLFMMLWVRNPLLAETPADPITGLWMTEDRDGGIELYSCDAQICGRFYWLKDDETNGDISRDTKNPDPDKRNRPLCGLEFMSDFTPDGKGHYTDGTIYSPRHGANFSAEMTLADHNTLNLRGYLLFPFLGQTQIVETRHDHAECVADRKPVG